MPLPATLRPSPPVWLLPAAFALLYAPVYAQLLTQTWRVDGNGYGYIVGAIALGLFWQHRAAFRTAFAGPDAINPDPAVGGLILSAGLLLQMFGRSQDVLALEVLSQVPVAAGALLCLYGRALVRQLAFPLAYLIFLVPVPPIVVELVTAPLKQLVSATVASLLYHTGYPVARSGVVLQAGGYRLLVADACSGLHSIFSLFALGLVYLH